MKTIYGAAIITVLLIVIVGSHGDEYLKQLKNVLTTHSPLSEDFGQIKEFLKEHKVSNGSVCTLCEQVAETIIFYRRNGASRNTIISLLKYVCTNIEQMDFKVCTGLISINIDTYLYILDNRKGLTAARVCSIYLPDNRCFDPQATNWTINIPPRRVSQISKVQHVSSSKPLKVLHLTDIHYDPKYLPGSTAVCIEDLCCESDSTQLHNGTKVPAGYWGDYHVCDMPWHSVQSMFDNIKAYHNNADLVYYTGDIISHRMWTTSPEDNSNTISKIFHKMAATFGATKVYAVLGNHESHPVDQWSPKSVANSSLTINWLYDLVAREWSQWLPQDAIATILKGGFYTTLVKPGFRIIALNTNVAFTKNVWLIYDDVDPYGQLQWLVDTLLQAEEKGELVHILSHVPPSAEYTYGVWMYQYRRIIERFAHIISAQFNGHTHYDELKVFYNSTDPKEVISVAFNGGSFTTFIGNNPNYRTYDVSPNNYEVLNYDDWIYNLTEANENPNKPPRWYQLYSFKEAYGIPDLSLNSFKTLLPNMAKNRTLLQQYFRFYVRESDVRLQSGCDDACLINLLCDITQVDLEENPQCIHFKEIFYGSAVHVQLNV